MRMAGLCRFAAAPPGQAKSQNPLSGQNDAKRQGQDNGQVPNKRVYLVPPQGHRGGLRNPGRLGRGRHAPRPRPRPRRRRRLSRNRQGERQAHFIHDDRFSVGGLLDARHDPPYRRHRAGRTLGRGLGALPSRGSDDGRPRRPVSLVPCGLHRPCRRLLCQEVPRPHARRGRPGRRERHLNPHGDRAGDGRRPPPLP